MAREDECFYVEQCEKDCGISLESNGAVKSHVRCLRCSQPPSLTWRSLSFVSELSLKSDAKSTTSSSLATDATSWEMTTNLVFAAAVAATATFAAFAAAVELEVYFVGTFPRWISPLSSCCRLLRGFTKFERPDVPLAFNDFFCTFAHGLVLLVCCCSATPPYNFFLLGWSRANWTRLKMRFFRR